VTPGGLRVLTDEQLREAWEDGCTEEEIAEMSGESAEEIRYRRRKVLRLRKRPDKWVPTPEEIAEATARIQEGWSEATREARRVSPEPSWSVPRVALADTELGGAEEDWA
jgi:hypothetical protein